MERQPSPYPSNCVSSWKSTNLTKLVQDPAGLHREKNMIKYSIAVRKHFFDIKQGLNSLMVKTNLAHLIILLQTSNAKECAFIAAL